MISDILSRICTTGDRGAISDRRILFFLKGLDHLGPGATRFFLGDYLTDGQRIHLEMKLPFSPPFLHGSRLAIGIIEIAIDDASQFHDSIALV
jgi:hypothetical protein